MFWLIPVALINVGILTVQYFRDRETKSEKERRIKLEEMTGTLKEMKKFFEEKEKTDLADKCNNLLEEADKDRWTIIIDGPDCTFDSFKTRYESLRKKYESLY